MSKKINQKAMIASLLFVILFTGVIYVSGTGMFEYSFIDESRVYAQPNIGSLCCWESPERELQVQLDDTVDRGIFPVTWTDYIFEDICSENVDSSGCDYMFRSSNPGLLVKPSVSIISEQGSCEFGEGTNCDPMVIDTWEGITELDRLYLPAVERGSRVKIIISGQTGEFATITKMFVPYVLQYAGGTGGFVEWNSEGCTVEKTNSVSDLLESQLIVDDTSGKYDYVTNSIPQGQCANFIESWQLSPIEFAPELNGEKVGCMLGAIYDINTITFEGGTSLQVLDNLIGTYGPGQSKECCSGMSTPTQECINWEWIDKEDAIKSCNLPIECQIGQFLGGWQVDYLETTGTSIIRGDCIDNVCDYRAEVQEVECTDHGMCTGDTPMCDLGDTWKCVASIGDITILPPGSGGNIIPTGSIWHFLLPILIIATLFGLVAYAITRDWIWAITGAFVGGLSGYVLRLMIDWVSAHPILSTLMVGGGVIFWFIGAGGILGIFTLVVGQVKKRVGKK